MKHILTDLRINLLGNGRWVASESWPSISRTLPTSLCAHTTKSKGGQDQTGLFGEGELPAGNPGPGAPTASGGRPRGLHAQRDQVELRAVLLWHALAHNFMRMRSLNIAIAT